ncbi:MAG: hypothetical protein QM589_11270 [Thermomicrobiales bacterium]
MKERKTSPTRRRSGGGGRRPADSLARLFATGGRVCTLVPMLAVLMSVAPSFAAAAAVGGAGNAASVAAQDTLPSITIDMRECAPTSGTSDDAQARSWDDLSADCTQPLGNVTTHLTATATGQDSPKTSNDDGRIAYTDLQPGDYTVYTDIPRGTAWEVVYCSVDGGAPYQKAFNESIVTTFSDLQTEQVVCTWFVIPVEAEAATPTPTTEAMDTPTATAPAVVPTATPTDAPAGGVITVDAFTCPADAGLDDSSSFQELNAACTTSAPDVTVHLMDEATGADNAQDTGSGGMLTWNDLDPGTYSAYTDVPRGTAQEVLYCSDLAGDISPVAFNENVVATFQLEEGGRFDCSWFILPAGTDGAVDETPTATATATQPEVSTETPTATATATAAPTETLVPTEPSATSLTVHLALCPQDYSGSDYYDDCHTNGVDGMEFLLDGPDGQLSETTTLPETPGPGVAVFENLSGGDYTLAGGPPGDFGQVVLYCTTQPDGTRIDAPVSGAQASLTIGEGENVLCDWYYIPENAQGETPTQTATAVPTGTTAPTATPSPTEAPRAAILVTLYSCPAPDAGTTYGGATYDQLKQSCGTTVDDVPFSLGDVGAPPLVANTGISGSGAVRFYDLVPADYTLSPTLPDSLTSTAVFCTIDGDNRYQKALQNGGVTFVNVESEQISCDWFAVSAPQPTPPPTVTVTTEPSQPTPTTQPTSTPVGPTGSITVREYLCAKDKSAITDWDRECTPGTTGATFLLSNDQLGVNTKGTTSTDNGVLVFAKLKDGHYTLKQESGAWCKATADRVDSESRVIVADGTNTDVVIYQCNATTSLPSTGTGTQISSNDRNTVVTFAVLALVVVSAALALMSVATFVRTERQRRVTAPRETVGVPVRTESGRMRMRFR